MTENRAMTDRHLIQVVSGFRPDVDGMGDYARHLAEELWRQAQVSSTILVFHRPKNGTEVADGEGWSVCYPPTASAQSLAAELQRQMQLKPQARVLLHYGPYAYSDDGMPLRFAESMAGLSADRRLTVFFHELWARGWPWKRAFWTRSNQLRAVRTLLAASRLGLSSSALYLNRLRSILEVQKPLVQVRIFSNIGEVERPLPLRKREPRLVVFGQIATRIRLYRQYGKQLEKLCSILHLESVVDAGSGESEAIPERIGSLPLKRRGFLSEEAASNLLATSVAGVLHYGPIAWEKSGVVAAYQAHGMLPIIAPRVMEGFRPFPGMPFALIGDLLRKREPMRLEEMQALADQAHGFYCQEVALAQAALRITTALELNR